MSARIDRGAKGFKLASLERLDRRGIQMQPIGSLNHAPSGLLTRRRQLCAGPRFRTFLVPLAHRQPGLA